MEHNCGSEYCNKHATSTWLSRKFQKKVRDDYSCSVFGVVNYVKRICMLGIDTKQEYQTKRKAKDALQGNDMEQYHTHWDYVEIVRECNPGSYLAIQKGRRAIEDGAIFTKLFYGLGV